MKKTGYDFEMQLQVNKGLGNWRQGALEIVEGLLARVGRGPCDDLLDLWISLRKGEGWREVMRAFWKVRQCREADHYLVVYRLRRHLGYWVALEMRGICAAEVLNWQRVLWRPYREWSEVESALKRERFEWEIGQSGFRGEEIILTPGNGRELR